MQITDSFFITMMYVLKPNGKFKVPQSSTSIFSGGGLKFKTIFGQNMNKKLKIFPNSLRIRKLAKIPTV